MTGKDEVKLSSKTLDFLAESPHKSFIGGEWVESANGQKMTVINPGSGETITEFYVMQSSDVDRAVSAGEEAFCSSGWATMSPEERGVYINRLADLIDRDADVIGEIEALEAGLLFTEGRNFAFWSAGTYRYYADVALHIKYNNPVSVEGLEAREFLQPYGVCAIINPWNGPFVMNALNCGAPLAAGNTVVIKPASNTPLSTLYFVRLAVEAGIPAGVINVVAGPSGTTGHALVNNPRIKRLCLTGSVEAGRSVAAACGNNLVPVALELGGKGAAVLFEDIDIEDTAVKLAQAITWSAGQACCTATRWIIHESIYDDFISAVVPKMKAVQVGHQFDPQTQMGPVASDVQRDRVLSYIKRSEAEGATVLVGGEAAEVAGYPGGFYVQPTLLAGTLDNIAAREEIFGPVAYIARFRDEAEAIKMVNSTQFGLGNSVWSRDLERCNRVAEKMIAGSSWINAHNVAPTGLRFSGVNNSGMGNGVACPSTVSEYLRVLSIARPL